MRHIKTYLLLAVIALQIGAAQAALIVPHSPSQRVKLFADCAGRFSALAQHQRLFEGETSERSVAMADQFAMLVDAVLPDAVDYGLDARQPFHWRIQAKAAQAALLHEATFHTDPGRSERAMMAAQANLAKCDGVMLGS